MPHPSAGLRHLCGDHIGDVDVVRYALKATQHIDGRRYQIVLMLQPTSPLRTVTNVSDTLRMLVDVGWDSVWTVSPTGSKAHPLKQLTISGGALRHSAMGALDTGWADDWSTATTRSTRRRSARLSSTSGADFKSATSYARPNQGSVIRVVVFDFDGTLVNSNAIEREGFFRLAARYSKGTATMADVIRASSNGRWILSAFAGCMAAEGVSLNVDELVESYGARVDTAVAAAPEMPGASDLLVDLRYAGLRLHLSSATPTASLLAMLDTRGWTVLFDGIHGAPKSKIETLQ